MPPRSVAASCALQLAPTSRPLRVGLARGTLSMAGLEQRAEICGTPRKQDSSHWMELEDPWRGDARLPMRIRSRSDATCPPRVTWRCTLEFVPR